MYLARATFNTLSTNMKNLERMSSIYETDPSKFANVSKKDKDKRMLKIKEQGVRFKRLESDFNHLESNSSTQTNDIESGINRERSEDGEYEATKGKTNEMVLQQQK